MYIAVGVGKPPNWDDSIVLDNTGPDTLIRVSKPPFSIGGQQSIGMNCCLNVNLAVRKYLFFCIVRLRSHNVFFQFEFVVKSPLGQTSDRRQCWDLIRPIWQENNLFIAPLQIRPDSENGLLQDSVSILCWCRGWEFKFNVETGTKDLCWRGSCVFLYIS